ncbi:MAG: stability determinant [Sphingomonadaceae bacterium]
MNELSPIVSEFASQEDAAAYAEWLKRKVEASLRDQRECLAHDEVMKDALAIVGSQEK